MKLYHGTTYKNIKKFEIRERKLPTKEKDCGAPDLGPGVYFSPTLKQAKDFAFTKYKTKECAVYEIDIDLNLLNGIIKNDPDEDYYLLCCLSRINLSDVAIETIENYKECDYIFGKVIKDVKNFDKIANMFIIQEDEHKFNSNDWNALINELKKDVVFHKDMSQYCFKDKAIDFVNNSIKKVYFISKDNKNNTQVDLEKDLKYDSVDKIFKCASN